MSRIRIHVLAAAAVIAATSVTGGATAWASAAAGPSAQAHVTIRPDTVIGRGYGDGSTAAIAKNHADEDLVGNFYGCVYPYGLVYDTQHPDGTWSAEVEASCAGYR
jgi:hypothetical protein